MLPLTDKEASEVDRLIQAAYKATGYRIDEIVYRLVNEERARDARPLTHNSINALTDCHHRSPANNEPCFRPATHNGPHRSARLLEWDTDANGHTTEARLDITELKGR